MVSWEFLIIGSLAAVGAALAVGTLAALARHRRTGTFPGADPDDGPVELTRGRLAGLWLRVVIGLALAVWGVASMAREGLL